MAEFYKVSDEMTKNILFVGADATIAQADHMMKNYWIRHLPVLRIGIFKPESIHSKI